MAFTVKNSDSPESSPENFADLLAGHQPRLAAYIRSLTADEQASRDILQEANVTILKKSRDFTPGTNFTAWSFRVAYFEVLTWRRTKGRDRIQLDESLVNSIAETVEVVSTSYDDRLDALKSCIAELPDRQREIIQRRYLNGESVQVIADDLGFKANAASQLLHRARTNLFKCINQTAAS
tara:strand:+ start:334 stop:873 length:540 start_codon:yes stop_codon:yes gene_type:complete